MLREDFPIYHRRISQIRIFMSLHIYLFSLFMEFFQKSLHTQLNSLFLSSFFEDWSDKFIFAHSTEN